MKLKTSPDLDDVWHLMLIENKGLEKLFEIVSCATKGVLGFWSLGTLNGGK